MFQSVSKDQLNSIRGPKDDKAQFAGIELLDECIKEDQNLHNALEKSRKEYGEKNYDQFYKRIGQCVKKSSDLCQKIRGLMVEYGDPQGYKTLKSQIAHGQEPVPEDQKIQFMELKPEGIKIILPDLLPSRINYKNIKERAVENIDYVRCNYIGAFSEYFADKNYTFQDRVVIMIKHFYVSESAIKDDDNYDYKIITDMIAEYVLVDDSPKYCTKVYDYAIGDRNHTEISIFPVHDWLQHMELPFL